MMVTFDTFDSLRQRLLDAEKKFDKFNKLVAANEQTGQLLKVLRTEAQKEVAEAKDAVLGFTRQDPEHGDTNTSGRISGDLRTAGGH